MFNSPLVIDFDIASIGSIYYLRNNTTSAYTAFNVISNGQRLKSHYVGQIQLGQADLYLQPQRSQRTEMNDRELCGKGDKSTVISHSFIHTDSMDKRAMMGILKSPVVSNLFLACDPVLTAQILNALETFFSLS